MTTYPAPMCLWCVHCHRELMTCAAFPEGIPDAILRGYFDHRMTFLGDHGILFQLKPGENLESFEGYMSIVY